MAIDIKVPQLGESVTEATVAKWLKAVGDSVAADEPLVELETDKVTVEVNAPAAGTLAEIAAQAGADVAVGARLGAIAEGQGAAKAPPAAKPAPAQAPAPAAKPAAPASAQPLAPSVRKLVVENRLEPSQIAPTGKAGRLTKGDVLAHLATGGTPAPASTPAPSGPRPKGEREERVRMTRLRQRIAERMKEAQNTAAMLTTFNEADMSAVIELRTRYRESFEKRHGVRLGFMSFFVKAAVAALKEVPAVNAEIDGTDIVYKNYYDIGVAVGTAHGLVVPVVRDADRLAFAEVETAINDLGRRARDGKLSLDEMQGGTFTITNGGVYGSLNSTPILNAPQSGILGMHKIQERPVVVAGGAIAARPMMYLALSYDHRIVDGREAVTFLVRIKDLIEAPERLMLDA